MSSDAAYIQTTYDQLARAGASDLCCSPVELYTEEELELLPQSVLRLSSGCGHPVDDADLRPGMTVLDIGSGAGADCLLAAARVGPTGRVIGVDPSDSMRSIAEQSRLETGVEQVSYLSGTADRLPVDDDSIDVVISNCVLSLSVAPEDTWTEIARVLRPGGRITVSDIVGGRPDATVVTQARCETGLTWDAYQRILLDNGFSGVDPLRVRQARFRDGALAASVTLQARHGMPPGHAIIQVLHRPHARALADELTETVTDIARAQRPLSVRRADLTDRGAEDLAQLLFPDGDYPDVIVAADGRVLLAGADATAETLARLLV